MKVSPKVIIIKPEEDEPVVVDRPFKVKPRYFKVKPRPARSITQLWFTPVHPRSVLSIDELQPNQEYAFFRFFPARGGNRIVRATGAELQQSWARAFKRRVKQPAFDSFLAAFHKRPSPKQRKHHRPQGLWRDVLMNPRADLYFSVQPVRKKHYGRPKTHG